MLAYEMYENLKQNTLPYRKLIFIPDCFKEAKNEFRFLAYLSPSSRNIVSFMSILQKNGKVILCRVTSIKPPQLWLKSHKAPNKKHRPMVNERAKTPKLTWHVGNRCG